MTENSDKLDNMTVRRFAKLIKGNGSNNGSTGITTGTVIQNDNQLFVAVDDETLVPVSDTASNVNVGDKVTLAIDNEEALIVGNNSDASPTASELSETDTKATFAKVDASEAKDTAQTAQVTANTAQNTAETAQTTADNAQSTATEAQTTAQTAKETADAVDGKATEAKETATQAQATATTASETATQAKETAEAVDAKATEAQSTATEANTKATEAQTTANTAQTTANTAKETADTASTKADNAQSTADTANTKADNAQSTADTASSKADNAQSTADTASSKADTAQETADNASKVATNYIDFDETNGLVIGDKREGATLTANTQINSEGFFIREGDTVLAGFMGNMIGLGINSPDSLIQLGSRGLSVSYDENMGVNLDSGLNQEVYGKNQSLIIRGGYHNDEMTNQQNTIEFNKNTINIKNYTNTLSNEKSTTYSQDLDGATLTVTKTDASDIKKPVTTTKTLNFSLDGFTLDNTLVSLEGHTHTQSDITDFAHTHTKSDITDFSHTHTKSEISDFEHDHTGEDLYPYSVHAKNDIRVHDTVVSLNGHTHEADDLTTTTPIFYLKTLSNTYTCNGASHVTVNFNIPAITGYTCVGCVDWQFGNASMVTRWNFAYSTKLWSLYGYNRISSSVSGTAKVKLLYVKSGWISCS